MKKSDIISVIQDNDISEYYSLKHLGIEGYAFPDHEALKIVQLCKLLYNFFINNETFVITHTPIAESHSDSLLLNTLKR